MTLSDAPEAGEIELSLFGPGYGECAAIHIGDGRWVIVDSCLVEGLRPAALAYFDSLGIDPSEAVCLVVATHWHDDHIRGMGELVKVCANAQFCCGSALSTKEYLSVLGALEKRPATPGGSGMREMYQVFSLLRERSTAGTYAVSDRVVFNQGSCMMWSLSPSDEAYERFLRQLGSLLPDELEPKRRVPPLTPNDAAVVLLIKIDETAILLGADLERRGWLEILDGSALPDFTASVFKVPHHGSLNAHEDRVWKELLCEDPVALLTPWQRGGGSLPTKNDVQRILSFTSKAYVTTSQDNSGGSAVQSRSNAVQRTIRESGVRIRPVRLSSGMIRVRHKGRASAEWTVERFGPACELETLFE